MSLEILAMPALRHRRLISPLVIRGFFRFSGFDLDRLETILFLGISKLYDFLFLSFAGII